jgi:peptidyl-tRNA hydrolase
MQDQEKDPLTCYLIVNGQLEMSVGKTAAQVAHAMQYLLTRYYEQLIVGIKDFGIFMDEKPAYWREFNEWMQQTNHRKVVLKADANDWEKLKGIPHVIVRDAGLTELTPGSETAIGLFPMRKSQAPKVVKGLQALK